MRAIALLTASRRGVGLPSRAARLYPGDSKLRYSGRYCQNMQPEAPPARVSQSRAVSSCGADCFFQVTPPFAMPA